MNWTLLNETNPEDGVRLTYKGGSSCRKRNTPEVIKETNETWKDTERIFEIELECDRQLGADANSFITDLINSGATIQVEERSPPDECHYIMRWRSQYACPIQGVTLSSMGNTLFRWLFLAAVCAIVFAPVSYTHLRAHETPEHLVCRLLLEKKKKKKTKYTKMKTT
eukprot:TRINITY_DN22990_c0_g1_i5.p1 TRINITY_DN22990_c0_g1~~TRINITY_DN22990_c0_g1_i5.p1  ORF type:complete len:167 (-),score=59.20 TRINITY_DN22990_c0_g1_i5:73-573(-)